MAGLDVNAIISHLDKISASLKEKPEKALKVIKEFSRIIDQQTPYRDGHAQRVYAYAIKIGKHLGLSDHEMFILKATALLHDFGKIGIDETLLQKITLLTTSERKEIRKHAIRGYYLLQGFPELNEILKGVRSHHEWYNGSGYPLRLTGENIPLIGRIIAVVDAYDAMTSSRPYRRTKTQTEASQELVELSEKQFDPCIVRIFISIIGKGRMEFTS